MFLLLLWQQWQLSIESNIKCPNTNEKYNCWRDELENTLEKKGLGASFDVLAVLYETEPDFVSECHGYTHDLGQQAYFLFSKNQDIEITPKASYCGYGFYHGFMETLLHTGGGIKEAQDFCSYADQKLALYSKKTSITCYHGIGHGVVDGSDPRNWGDAQKLIQPGLDICKTVSVLPEQINQCGTGVFNALAIALNSNLYNLNSSEEPYKICSSQELVFKKACYEQMNSRVVAFSKRDFKVASKLVISIADKKYSIIAMEQLVPAFIADKVGQNNSFSEEVQVCKSIPEYLVTPCIQGIVGGIMEFGKPDYEYEEAINFCRLADLNEAEREGCFKYVLANARMLYAAEKINLVCGLFDKKHEKICEN